MRRTKKINMLFVSFSLFLPLFFPIVNNSGARKPNNCYLDVPSMNMQHLQLSDPDIVRTFSSSKQGIVNRGDSFRRRRSRSNSLAPVSPMQTMSAVEDTMAAAHGGGGGGGGGGNGPVETFKVLMLGGPGVGKTALLSQFKTSECINAYESGRGKCVEWRIYF